MNAGFVPQEIIINKENFNIFYVANLFNFSFLVLASLSKINEAIDSNDASLILACLQLPTAKLNNVRPKNAELYMIMLKEAKKEKAEVIESVFNIQVFFILAVCVYSK